MIELARLLADGTWHSGEDLAAALGVSRAAVWKRIARARESGLVIDAVRGRGYRLRPRFEPLDAARIRAGLAGETRAALVDLEVLGVVDSTNTRLLVRDDPRPAACVAEQQTAGRGRRGRDWVSPFGTNVYLSVAWTFDPAPPAIGALGLAIGTALAETLRAQGVGAVGMKWPNDLVVNGAKLGGILLEHRGEAAGGCRVVVGVGLNVRMTADQAQPLAQAWTTLEDVLQAAPSRNQLACALLNAVVRALRQFAAEGFAPFRLRWREFDVLAGREVVAISEHERSVGRAVGIATDGALLIDVEGQRRRLYSGDVSVRVQG